MRKNDKKISCDIMLPRCFDGLKVIGCLFIRKEPCIYSLEKEEINEVFFTYFAQSFPSKLEHFSFSFKLEYFLFSFTPKMEKKDLFDNFKDVDGNNFLELTKRIAETWRYYG